MSDDVKYFANKEERYEDLLIELLSYNIGEENKEIIREALDYCEVEYK